VTYARNGRRRHARPELYERSAGAEAVAQIRELAAPLEGARILHVNATPYGGGVAEILRSEIPLLRNLGLLADWKLITGDQTFFSVTKAIHNGLQGAPRELAPAEQETYLTHSIRNAQLLEEEYDIIVVHDPQPLALLRLHGKGTARWIWRYHIDTSEPNLQVWNFLRPYLEGYDATVFTLGSFAPPDIPAERVEIIPPAIDPESPKNVELDARVASRLLRWIGVEVEQPLVTQVSRFDPWKDPLGVIAAYRSSNPKCPGCNWGWRARWRSTTRKGGRSTARSRSLPRTTRRSTSSLTLQAWETWRSTPSSASLT